MRLLNDQNNRLRIFDTQEGIIISKLTPKYALLNTKSNESATNPMYDEKVQSVEEIGEKERRYYDWLAKHIRDISDLKISDFNIFIALNIYNKLYKERWYGSSINTPKASKPSWKDIVKQCVGNLHKKLSREEFNVLDFFANVKGFSDEELGQYVDRTKDMCFSVLYAYKAGQTALLEKLLNALVISKYESELYAKGYRQAISEKSLVAFAKGCPKDLALDYIENYTRVIPVETMIKKEAADKLLIFDNYVVCHYDPDEKSYEQTLKEKAAEEEKKRDPILFGIIAGSNKLYHIDSWIDDYCDLTFQQIASTLGQEVIEKDFIKEKIDFNL